MNRNPSPASTSTAGAIRPTHERLSSALRQAGYPQLADAAWRGEFDQIHATIVDPLGTLVGILRDKGRPAAARVADWIEEGQFDATADEWRRHADDSRFRRLIGDDHRPTGVLGDDLGAAA